MPSDGVRCADLIRSLMRLRVFLSWLCQYIQSSHASTVKVMFLINGFFGFFQFDQIQALYLTGTQLGN